MVDFVREQRLNVAWILETHAHADHLSAAPWLRSQLGGKIAIGGNIRTVQGVFKKIFNLEDSFNADGSQFDHLFSDGERFSVGALEGKVAFVTGAARGQGRAHALTLAAAGADIIAVDLCEQIASVPYPLATPEDLQTTVGQVADIGSRIVARHADVRDRAALKTALQEGISELGRLDIVIANAGIAPMMGEQAWQDVIDVNLTGVYHTVDVAIGPLIRQGDGGSIVLTSSVAGLVGIGAPIAGSLGYTAAKHGIVGLMRAYANFLAQYSIRVNSVHPAGVDTPMIDNEFTRSWLDGIAQQQAGGPDMSNALPVATLAAEDVANAVLWLVSDAARYITGVALPVDAGFVNKR
ncbi:MAG: SDR family mycofactocin-dependent oxidoreductase [Mycobacterium sp.]|nr:SDR family mycofactocin-dependent oxidoreductase [Mycobacterium sp.]